MYYRVSHYDLYWMRGIKPIRSIVENSVVNIQSSRAACSAVRWIPTDRSHYFFLILFVIGFYAAGAVFRSTPAIKDDFRKIVNSAPATRGVKSKVILTTTFRYGLWIMWPRSKPHAINHHQPPTRSTAVQQYAYDTLYSTCALDGGRGSRRIPTYWFGPSTEHAVGGGIRILLRVPTSHAYLTTRTARATRVHDAFIRIRSSTERDVWKQVALVHRVWPENVGRDAI
jgi:hypothetical protein